MNILSVNGLTRRFGGLVAVNNVSMEVRRGSITAVIGPNGAGKTTLFNTISGFIRPSDGSVSFEGKDVTSVRPDRIAARGMVRTFQLVQLFKGLTAQQNVEVGRHAKTQGGVGAAIFRPGWARRQEDAVASSALELLELVGLAGQANVAAGALPYGQQRLLEIARALAAEPSLLLLDEPAAGLDRKETAHLSGIIRNIAARGITVLLIEHDMALVMNIAEKIVVLDFGLCIAQGTPNEIRADKRVLEAYLGGVESANV